LTLSRHKPPNIRPKLLFQTPFILCISDVESDQTSQPRINVCSSDRIVVMLLVQEFKYVQASISSLQSVYLAVVTQLKRQQLNITRRVTTVASTFDPRLTVSLDTSKCSRIRSVSFVLEVGFSSLKRSSLADAIIVLH